MSISKHGTLNKIETAKSVRDAALSHTGTLIATLLPIIIGGITSFLTGAEITAYVEQMGVAGIMIKALLDHFIPMINRKFNINRV